jgi:hypothetical protein
LTFNTARKRPLRQTRLEAQVRVETSLTRLAAFDRGARSAKAEQTILKKDLYRSRIFLKYTFREIYFRWSCGLSKSTDAIFLFVFFRRRTTQKSGGRDFGGKV